MTQTTSSIKIISLASVASFLVLILAVISQTIFHLKIHETSELASTNNTFDAFGPDTKSALKRIRTEQCRQEIVRYVQQYVSKQNRVGHLKRLCPHDSTTIPRVVKLGCSNEVTLTKSSHISSSKPSSYVTLDDNQATDIDSCNELCYSFGHAYASYSYVSHRCYCAENELFKLNKLSPCDEYPATTDQVKLVWFRVNNGIYYSAEQRNFGPGFNGTQVRIAFLLSFNGRSTLQVLRLLKRIYSRNHLYYIHIDRREMFLIEDLKSYTNEYDNILFSSQRLETIWGGTALLSMMINAMEDLKEHHWHYLINLSESDFPIRNLFELETYLGDNSQSSIYLKAHNTKGYHFIKKQGLDYNFYQCEGRVWRLDKRQLPRGIIYTGGSDWFGLPRDFCDHIIEYRNKPGSLVYSLLQVFNYTLLPAESYFHTLSQNGEFCDRLVDNNLRVTNWYRKRGCKCQHEKIVDWCGCSPSIYRWIDTARLRRAADGTAIFFSRKFDPTVSNSIIGFVEAHLLDRSAGSTVIDTRYWLNTFETSYDVLPGYAKRFGHLAMSQLNPTSYYYSIKSIHKYFDKDKFKGHIYEYCDENTCMELLITTRVTYQPTEVKDICFHNNPQLKFLEVNQNFDPVERLFRSNDPLNSLSDIVVQHEWIVRHSVNSSYQDISFKWLNPNGEIELIQDAKLKSHSTANRISLVHRLYIKKPLRPGSWKLVLTKSDIDCLEYEFLVFDSESHDNHEPNQVQFDKFYRVFPGCKNGKGINDNTSCADIDWSLESKNSFLAKYRL